jgi:hypothetical protein
VSKKVLELSIGSISLVKKQEVSEPDKSYINEEATQRFKTLQAPVRSRELAITICRENRKLGRG